MTVVKFTPRKETFDEAAEKCALILDMSRARDNIESIAMRLFESFTYFPIKDARRMNEHLMDAKKSIAAAVAAMPTRSK